MYFVSQIYDILLISLSYNVYADYHIHIFCDTADEMLLNVMNQTLN